MTGEKKYPVMEIFGPTIQGEGLMSGTITHFLRLGGCGLRCSWCDTMFAVDPLKVRSGRTMMSIDEIIQRLQQLGHAPYVTLTGGDPCLHKDLEPLINQLNFNGIEVAVETQGQLFPEWLVKADVITFSPKPPSSGNVVDYHHMIEEMDRMFMGPYSRRDKRICIKVVCFDQGDFEYATQVLQAMPYTMYDSFYFTSGTTVHEEEEEEAPKEPADLAVRAVDRTFDVLACFRGLSQDVVARADQFQFNEKVHVGCQQHVLIWPEQEQGV